MYLMSDNATPDVKISHLDKMCHICTHLWQQYANLFLYTMFPLDLSTSSMQVF